jgi:type VI secretion system protein
MGSTICQRSTVICPLLRTSSIEAMLLKYEPRLKSIDVIEKTEPGMLLSFTMSCYLHREGLVRFGTHFTPDGQTRLTMLRWERD